MCVCFVLVRVSPFFVRFLSLDYNFYDKEYQVSEFQLGIGFSGSRTTITATTSSCCS